MYRSLEKPTPRHLQEPPSPQSARDWRGVGPSLYGWALWLYVGLILAALAALIAPPVYRWLAPLVKP